MVFHGGNRGNRGNGIGNPRVAVEETVSILVFGVFVSGARLAFGVDVVIFPSAVPILSLKGASPFQIYFEGREISC